MITFEDVQQIVRDSALTVFRRRAERLKMAVTLCSNCRAFIDEDPTSEEGYIAWALCKECLPLTSEKIQ